MTTARRRALVGLSIALALADSSVVTLALPDILRRFDVEIPQVAWVLTSYNLGLALAAVPAAYAARRRPVPAFVLGTLVFAAASLVCGLAPTFGVLVGARCVQAAPRLPAAGCGGPPSRVHRVGGNRDFHHAGQGGSSPLG